MIPKNFGSVAFTQIVHKMAVSVARSAAKYVRQTGHDG